MNRLKRSLAIISLILLSMLIIPLVTLHTVKADAGMLVTLLLFFTVNPIVSVAVGMLAGRDTRFFWFSPILVAVLFWIFSSLIYETAFPLLYSAIYLVISTVSMLITHLITKK